MAHNYGTTLKPRIILASASPRRQELLRGLIDEFEVVPSDVDEEALTTKDPFETARRVALAKARRVSAQYPAAVVIGGDTVVALHRLDDYELFAKPRDKADAARMLRALSGDTHIVVTGVAIVFGASETVSHDVTAVTFRELSAEEIESYVSTAEPYDKAGSYAIQGGAASFVAQLEGSLDNVIGLPTELLRSYLTVRV